MHRVHRENATYPPAWKDPSGLTHPVLKTKHIAGEGSDYVVEVAACHPGRFIKQNEVVFDAPTTCLVCAIRSIR